MRKRIDIRKNEKTNPKIKDNISATMPYIILWLLQMFNSLSTLLVYLSRNCFYFHLIYDKKIDI